MSAKIALTTRCAPARRVATPALLFAALLLFGWTGHADANRVTYGGQGTEAKNVFMSFVLKGKNCPRGPRCFKGARVTRFGASSYGWANCDLLDSAFEFGPPGGPPKAVRVNRRRRFKGNGGNVDDFTDEVSFRGRFARKGRSAQGWFKVVRQGTCTTGRVYWRATPGG